MRALIITGFVFALGGFGVACYDQFVLVPAILDFKQSANYSEWLNEEYSLALQVSLIHSARNLGHAALISGILAFGISCIPFLKTGERFPLFIAFLGLGVAVWGLFLGLG